MKKTVVVTGVLFLCSFVFTSMVKAQKESVESLAKAAQNPVADLISLPFQNNINFGIGPDDDAQNILNIQPVLPVSINKNWMVITRTIAPVIYQPSVLTPPDEGAEFGLGDINFTAFLSPKKSKFIWGIGPSVLLPTATDDSLGGDKWAAGPSFVGLVMPGPWVVGALVSNIWSFAGSGDRDVNLLTFQPFVNYNFKSGWYLTSVPIITADWEADSDNTWTIPVGGGVGKVFKIGKQSMNAQVQSFYNVEKPDGGPDWQLRLQFQFLFPK